MKKEGRQIIHHSERCVGCFTCEVSCKQEYGLPVGMHLIKITPQGPYWKNGRLAMDYSIVQCRHCPDPECLAACPEEAIFKRPDGLVQIREDLCTGCQACLSVCPYQAMTFDEEQGKAAKCAACVHLLDEGRGLPACVKHCPTQALEFLVSEGGCS